MGEIGFSPFFEARAERNAYLASGMLILYEYFLQFDTEVEFFWKQRWSIAKGLFLWSRYYGLLFNISNAIVYLYPKPSYSICADFFHWQNTGASLQVITSHLILQLRLCAMYGNTWKIVALCVFLTCGEALTMGIIFGIPNDKLVGTNNPFPGLYICADADPSDGSRWLVYYWMSILITDTVLLSLALAKAWRYRPSTGLCSALMITLTKDSVVYFFIICSVYLANLVVWFFNRITLNELLTSFSFVISSILANRLLISLRRESFRCQPDAEIHSYMPSIRRTESLQFTTILDNVTPATTSTNGSRV